MSSLTVSHALGSLGVAVLAFSLWKVISLLIRPLVSPLRHLPGPPSSGWIHGSLAQIRDAESSTALHEAWVEQYGTTFRYKGWMGTDWLYTVDTRAINHILSHSYDYPKPKRTQFQLSQVLGAGLLIVEGEQHRQQRRILNPAFGPSQIREFTEVFVEKSSQLRDLWNAEIATNGEPARIDVLNGLSNMTLDVIGLAGFNYDFDSLNINGGQNELSAAFDVMFMSLTSARFSISAVLRGNIPLFRLIPNAMSTRTEVAQSVMRRIGMQLVAQKKAEVMKAAQAGEKAISKGLQSRDLLTLLIKANMSTDIPESQRLSDDDVLAQVPTFLVAGHETTSNATTWCLFALAQAPEIQEKLREELWNVPTENPTMEELNGLPYLDSVVRETMRVYAPVTNTIRVAAKDDVIPLNKPYTDVHGQVHDSVRISKGTTIPVPILAMNRLKELWGEDALEFKPERWEAIPDTVEHMPGVWSHMMSFLGGARACIGYRFALVEMKALVFTLVRAFEFDLAVPVQEITNRPALVQRPFVRSEMEKGSQLPLLVKPYVHQE